MDSADSFDHRIAVEAARTRRLITHGRLRALGLSQGAIEVRVDRDGLIRVIQGVYAVGVRLLDDPMLELAGQLYGGPDAALANTSAARAYGLLDHRPGNVWLARPGYRCPVIVQTQLRMADGGFGLIHLRPATLPPDEVRRVGGVRRTAVPRTLVDLAAYHPHLLERAWRQAEFRRLLDAGELRAARTRW